MTTQFDRRQFLVGSTIVAGATLGGLRPAHAATEIVGVEWGGSYIDAMKQAEASQDKVKVNWELHAAGAAAILAKIKATWPNPQYDFVASYDPVFISMIKEGWAEAITMDAVPNLADVPDIYIFKDQDGSFRNIPRSVSGHYFAYRPDICPIEFKSIDDLLDPRLKGQICWPSPIQMSGLHIVALAYHMGGSERDIEPGWKLLTEIVKSGNIGRIAETDTDLLNSMSSGETSITFWPMSALMHIAKNVQLKQLTKQEGMTTYMATTGFSVLKNRPNLAATLEFLNHCISPENNSIYSKLVYEAPVNRNAKVDAELNHMVFTKEESEKFVRLPDWEHMAAQVPALVRRWEQELAPLL